MKEYESFANLLINHKGATPIFNCLLNIKNLEKKINYKIALGNTGSSHENTTKNYRFRTGSITKIFTSTIILQLMEEGLLKLEDNFLDCLKNQSIKKIMSEILFFNEFNYSNQITIKNLLQHKSGLRDYFSDDERFFENIKKQPNKDWNWKKILEKYFEYDLNKKGISKPNENFYYSDTNYLLLAVLIEELTNKTFHKVLHDRLINPLSLHDTFLEFHENKRGSAPILYPYQGTYSLKNINTSFDWGGGGLISSVKDLNIFIRALLTGALFKELKTLKQMINFEDETIDSSPKKRRIAYGLGLQQKKIGQHYFIGHNSAYGGMLFYNLETETSIILNLNQVLAPHKAEWLLKKTVETFYN